MPRTARHTIRWDAEARHYVAGNSQGEVPIGDDELALWLDARGSFAFHGRHGSATLLRERRQELGYWYAYRRQGARTHKRYAGRGTALTLMHLEELAAALSTPTTEPGQPPSLPAALLEPKLTPPRLPAGLVARERLLERMRGALGRALTLVCAPAGFGKTTLVRQWVATHRPTVGWVTLDAGDNDPIRFWRSVITACARLLEDGGEAALAQLRLPPQPIYESSPLDLALLHLLNAATRAARPGALVLDDYHLITAPSIHATVAQLVDRLPPTLSVVIVARHPPSLPLARLRAHGLLDEIGVAELRFTPSETATALDGVGAPLPPTALSRLDAQLAGWPAGLRLLILALQGRQTEAEVAAALDAFAGSQRTLLEYFVTEVLERQPPEVQAFLLRTSVLTRLAGPLCETVAGAAGGASLLRVLERANLFIEPVGAGGEWYRYHTLFAEAMQEEGRRRLGAETLRRVSAAAGAWYEAQGLLPEAVEAALRAEEPARAADLLERVIGGAGYSFGSVQVQARYEFHTLRRWLEQIPTAELHRRPALCVGYATALMFVSLVDQVPVTPATLQQIQALLTSAEAGFGAAGDRAGLGQVYAFHAMLAGNSGPPGDAAPWARLALDHLDARDLGWRSVSLGSLGLAALDEGRYGDAEEAFVAALRMSQRIANRWWVRANSAMMSFLLLERGELQQAAARFEQMLAEARADGDRDDVARAQICLAHLAYERGDLDGAEAAATEALGIGAQHDSDEIVALAEIALARAEGARGRDTEAQRRLSALLARLETQPSAMQARMAREARLAHAALQLATGDTIGPWRWAERLPAEQGAPRPLIAERERRLLARLLIARGEPAAAAAMLSPMLADAEAGGRRRAAIETRLALALADGVSGRRAEALGALSRTLPEAAAMGLLRTVIDMGPAMVALAAAMAAERGQPQLPYLRALLRAAGASAVPPATEALSRQELRVLELLAAGQSQPEIARALVVSVNTVRTQVQSIYRKLDVHGRVAAIAAARRLGLLPNTP